MAINESCLIQTVSKLYVLLTFLHILNKCSFSTKKIDGWIMHYVNSMQLYCHYATMQHVKINFKKNRWKKRSCWRSKSFQIATSFKYTHTHTHIGCKYHKCMFSFNYFEGKSFVPSHSSMNVSSVQAEEAAVFTRCLLGLVLQRRAPLVDTWGIPPLSSPLLSLLTLQCQCCTENFHIYNWTGSDSAGLDALFLTL